MGTQHFHSKRGTTPNLRPMSVVAELLDGLRYGGRPRPRRLCVRWGPSSPEKGGTARPRNFLPVYIVAACKTKFNVKFVISALENVYRDVLHANMNQKIKILFFPAIFGCHLEYLELPKGDMTTPTLGFLLRSYATIIHPEKTISEKMGFRRKINFGSLTIGLM